MANKALAEHVAHLHAEAASAACDVMDCFALDGREAAPALPQAQLTKPLGAVQLAAPRFDRTSRRENGLLALRGATSSTLITGMVGTFATSAGSLAEIGRASCRERV